MATGKFSQVDKMVLSSGPGGVIPTLAQLQAYDAVLVYGDYGIAPGIGSVLANYVDGGGGVVVMVFALCATPIDAAFNNPTYNVITPGGYVSSGGVTLGTVLLPTHPIMAGVTSFNGGSNAFRTTSQTLNGNSYVVADWSDGNILVAAREGVGPKNAR